MQSTNKMNNLEKQDSQVIDIAQIIDVFHKVILVKKNKMIQRPTKSLMVVEAGAETSTQQLLEAMIPSLKCYYQLLIWDCFFSFSFLWGPLSFSSPPGASILAWRNEKFKTQF